MLRIIAILCLGVALAYGLDNQALAAYAERRPELVSLIVLNSFALPLQTCSGFVIDEQTIVTSARCIYDYHNPSILPLPLARLRFRAGSPFLNSGGTVYSLTSSFLFALHRPEVMSRDIAILGTPFTILFGDSVRPAAIGGYEVADGEQIHTVGWGYVTYPELYPELEFDLQHEMPQVTASWEDCKSVYADYGFTLEESTICTELANQSTITNPETLRHKCFGEAGGPVYHNGFVVGIRSFDVNCTVAIPTVNTKASSFLPRRNSMTVIVSTDV